MRVRNHGKYTNMSRFNPRAIATCDRSGFVVQHSKLVKQMEYNGQGLFWTGYWVYPKFLDKPNPQNLAPRVKLDPKPILNSKPDNIVGAQTTIATSVGVLTLDVSGGSDVTLTVDQFSNYGSFNFTGTLTADIVITVPNLLREFYANNLTQGDFTLRMKIIDNSSLPLTIPHASTTSLLGPVVFNTLYNLRITSI